MANEIRSRTVQKGIDPRNYARWPSAAQARCTERKWPKRGVRRSDRAAQTAYSAVGSFFISDLRYDAIPHLVPGLGRGRPFEASMPMRGMAKELPTA